MGARVGGLAHGGQPGGVVEQRGDECVQAFRGGLGVRQQDGGARVGQHPRVVRLVVAGRVRVRDQDRGHPDRRQFGDGRRTGPAHHEVGGGVGQVHPVQVRDGLGDRRAARRHQPLPGLLQRRGPGLDQQPQVRTGPVAGRQADRGLGEPGRTQAAAVDEQQPGAGRYAQLPARPFPQRRTVQVRQRPDQRHPDRLGVLAARQVRAAAVEGERDVRGEPGGELVGPAGHRVGLVDQAGQPGQPRPDDDRRARVAAHADRDLGFLLPQDRAALRARSQQRGGQQIALGAERRVEGNHVHGVQAVSGLRDEPRLQPALRTDEGDHRVGHGPAQGVREGEPGVDVAAGTARTDDD